ncbi:MAG: ATP-binding protein [Dehalococcoidia bacterium]|nr:ATP-binding protein [Dehalococcoidia bacterium]
MNIQIKQIKGDIVELLFDPEESDLCVGENLSIMEKGGQKGIIIQVIELRTVTYPALVSEMLSLAVEGHGSLPPGLFEFYRRELSETSNLKVAIAKIRKSVQNPGSEAQGQLDLGLETSDLRHWDQWDGWIPTRSVTMERISGEEVFANCLNSIAGHPVHLGKTLAEEDFAIEGQDLEKVNIITGVKGVGKSHLAKVILLQLIRNGAPCIIFDINREYIHLPTHEVNLLTGKVISKGIVHLEAGVNFKLGIRQFGLAPLMIMLAKYGLPEVSAMHFESRLARLLREMVEWESMDRKPPFVGLEQLIQMAEQGEFSDADVVNAAIRSRLIALKGTKIFAARPEEAASLRDSYREIRDGGALVIDVSGLSNAARSGLVQAIIEMIKEICDEEIESGCERFPFTFFEEAHLYVSRASIDYIVTRARHLGMSSFFVTNMIGGLDEAVLRQADNLFLLYLPFEDDVRHVSKSAITDYETLSSFVKRLRKYHALIIGRATSFYPLIVQVDHLEGVNTAGETRFFFKPATADKRPVEV